MGFVALSQWRLNGLLRSTIKNGQKRNGSDLFRAPHLIVTGPESGYTTNAQGDFWQVTAGRDALRGMAGDDYSQPEKKARNGITMSLEIRWLKRENKRSRSPLLLEAA